jgi:hypothetical protein
MESVLLVQDLLTFSADLFVDEEKARINRSVIPASKRWDLVEGFRVDGSSPLSCLKRFRTVSASA